ncbi:MAG: hypothetical protein WCF30_10475 [Terracidiphilus sp.]
MSYVLTQEGLVEGKADRKPKYRKVIVGECLSYTADEVPEIRLRADLGHGITGDARCGAVLGATFRRCMIKTHYYDSVVGSIW